MATITVGPPRIFMRPACSLCGSRMLLVRIFPDKPGYDQHTYECPRCGHEITDTVQFPEDRPKLPGQMNPLELDHAPSSMTRPSSWYAAARNWRMRAQEVHDIADDFKETEPRAIMLRIAADYERLAEWAEKNSVPWWDKKRANK